MTVPPVTKTRQVSISPEEAFRLFTEGLDTWWPLEGFSVGVGEKGEIPTAVRFEGRVGGQVVEVMADGTEYVWAEILEWDPPKLFRLAWHPSVNPTAASMLEVRFSPNGTGTTVHLEHWGWDAFGEEGAALQSGYDTGWDTVLAPYETMALPA